MTKYIIPITRECSETTLVDVDAATFEEAIVKALAEANAEPYNFEWTPDDGSGSGSDPYIAAGEELDEEDCRG